MRIIAIGVSTGGPNALALHCFSASRRILPVACSLFSTCPRVLPGMFARRLNDCSPIVGIGTLCLEIFSTPRLAHLCARGTAMKIRVRGTPQGRALLRL